MIRRNRPASRQAAGPGRPGIPLLLAAALAVVIGPPPARCQTETFEEETSVVLVEVPVQVLDGGRPVAGLTAGSFELYDDGERREIFSFEVLDVSAGAAAVPLPMTSAGPSPGPRRNFLFLIDFAYPDSWDPEIGAGPITAAIHGMKETWQDLSEMLESRFHPDDRLALAYFSPLDGLKMLQGWTSDRQVMAQAMDVLLAMIEARPAELRELWWEWEMTARSSRLGGSERLWATLDDLLSESRTAGVRADPFLPHRDVTRSLFEGLIDAGRTLADAAGPRHVVYFSTGFPSASLRQLRKLVQQFRRKHWAIQSIYTGGLGFGSNSLHMLSNETGGSVFANNNDVSVLLADMAEETAISYLLMFEAPPNPKKSKYRKIQVKLVDGPKGARVIHRQGYYSEGAQQDD